MKKAVIGIVLSDSDKKVLCLKRRDVPVWVLPGGGVEEGESPESACVREVLEETGIKTSIKRKIAEYTPLNNLAEYTETFALEVLGGIPTTGDETREVGFFPLSALPSPFFHVHEEWLRDALENREEVIRKKIRSVTYGKLLLYALRHPIRVGRFLLSRLGLPINAK